MKDIDSYKRKIQKVIIDKISCFPEVCSITFVGSFIETDNLSTVSDIDVIIIVEHLHAGIFQQIENSAKTITGIDCGLPDYEVKLNLSFGPLKFNSDKTVVFHLMIYDIKRHREHVINSPFTCYDWQYYKAVYGKNLSEIYPANALQLNDLIGTRRGLESYLRDIQKGVITFRNYIFQNDKVLEQTGSYPMDDRHKKEYAYHIMKFLMLNLLKILQQENNKYSDIVLAETFATLDPRFSMYTQFFSELSEWKYSQKSEPRNIFEKLESFIATLNQWFIELQQCLPRIVFMRHAKTELNDGTFLGVRRDPDILPTVGERIAVQKFDVVYTGTLKRTISTASHFEAKENIQDPLLNEIDYGLAEGLSVKEVSDQFPFIIDAWARNEDPKFPEGENQEDVLHRLDQFIGDMINRSLNNKSIGVVTHNVMIRALLGKFYHNHIHEIYCFCPGHLEQIPFRIFKGVLIPELDADQRIKFRDQYLVWA